VRIGEIGAWLMKRSREFQRNELFVIRKVDDAPLKLRPYGAIQICLLLLLLKCDQKERERECCEEAEL